MMTIIENAKLLLTQDGEKLVKDSKTIERLSNPQTSVYSSEAGEIIGRNPNMGLGKVLQQTGEGSEKQLSDFDHPIVDRYKMQMGFNGDETVAYTETVAPLKALLCAEGSITEGKYYHTGVTTEISKSVGVTGDALDDAYTARESTNVFAKRDQEGGWDPVQQIVTRTDNVSGLIMTAPFDYFDPWEPDLGNRLGEIASGIAYRMAEPFYNWAAENYSEEEKKQVLTVCTRNANGPTLDRMAREQFIAGLHIDVTNRDQAVLLAELMKMFRSARGSLAVPANTASNSTLRIGMPYAEHSVAGSIVWTNEQKVRHVKELEANGGQKIYMASSYMNHQLFTVPIDLDLLDEDDEIFNDLATWQQLAVRYCVNQSRKILGFSPIAISDSELNKFADYEGIDYPSVCDALDLSDSDNEVSKRMVLAAVNEYVRSSIVSWKEAVETKALNKYMNEG